ncbi:GNAT family N-acetyltransferase [Brucella pituitosa]|uniref:GNAT family N-acetyltransferase n=1 Tax=Brucella pituitosa TaxID=571256 RepID=A0A643EVC2_9HYPH|nr:GNAT family protein [Brucella pituitosa]KAB0566133.1 GNAT family N-acetyltransferase [Brucella pituitosa]
MTAILEGRNLRLRQASVEDVEARLSLGNHAEIIEMFGVSRGLQLPLTRDGATRWVQRLIDHPHAWVIEIHGRLIGEIRLDNVDLHDRRASMAVGILDPQLLGKGLGSEAILLLLRHAFADLQLHRIGIRVLAYNQRAIRAYKKCGFVIEGREREAAFVNGTWHDDVMMGLLEHEFFTRNS